MADESRTRTPIKDIIAWIQTQLATESSWNIAEHKNMDINNVFSYVPSLQCPACIVLHAGDDYSNPDIDRLLTFWVILVTRNMGDDAAAADACQDFVEKVMELLDNQIDSEIRYYIHSDEPMGQPNFGKIMYKVVLKAEDN